MLRRSGWMARGINKREIPSSCAFVSEREWRDQRRSDRSQRNSSTGKVQQKPQWGKKHGGSGVPRTLSDVWVWAGTEENHWAATTAPESSFIFRFQRSSTRCFYARRFIYVVPELAPIPTHFDKCEDCMGFATPVETHEFGWYTILERCIMAGILALIMMGSCTQIHSLLGRSLIYIPWSAEKWLW